MKKLICLFLSFVLILSSLGMLVSCDFNTSSDSTNNSKIPLTLDNYERYLTVMARYYGDGYGGSSSYPYTKVVSSVTVSSAAQYLQFYDCVIEVKIIGHYFSAGYSWKQTKETIKIPLNMGGSGSGFKITKDELSCVKGPEGDGYEIVSISGYVLVE